MLIHFNPAQPEIFVFACPRTMAIAVIHLPSKTLHPINLPNLGKLTDALSKKTQILMSEYVGKEIKFKTVTNSKVNLPEWLIFSMAPEALFIMHIGNPSFICPISNDMKVINPIADAPDITGKTLKDWVEKSQTTLETLKPELITLAELAPV